MFEESASAIPSSSSLWESMNSWFTPTVFFVLLNIMIGTILLTSSNSSTPKQPPQNDPNHPKIPRSPSVLQRLKSINFNSLNLKSQDPPQTPNKSSNPETPETTNFAQNLETHFFHQTHELNPLKTQTHIDFEQTHLQIPLSTTTQFVFQQNEPNPEVFNPTHQTHEDFDPTHQTEEDFDPTHLEKVEEEDEMMESMDEVYRKVTGGGHFIRTTSDTEPSSGKVPKKLPEKMRKSASMKSPFGHFEEEEIVETRRPARERGVAKVNDGDEEVDAKADDFINKFKQQLKLQRLDSIIRYKDMIGRGSGSGK